jgi:hypothetical protein
MAKLHCEIKAMVDFFDTPLPERIHNVIFIFESFSYIVRLYFESDFYINIIRVTEYLVHYVLWYVWQFRIHIRFSDVLFAASTNIFCDAKRRTYEENMDGGCLCVLSVHIAGKCLLLSICPTTHSPIPVQPSWI